MKITLAIVVAAAGACTTDAPADRTFCHARQIGDADRPAETTVAVVDGTRARDLHDGGTLVLAHDRAALRVSARNVDGCALAVRIAAVPQGAESPVATVGTIVELVADGEWGVPAATASSLLELPLDLDREYRLVVAVEDATGKAAASALHVTTHAP